jgi:hypothetical protein
MGEKTYSAGERKNIHLCSLQKSIEEKSREDQNR